MPPATSSNDTRPPSTPPRARATTGTTTSTTASPFAGIESPVPDFAATLLSSNVNSTAGGGGAQAVSAPQQGTGARIVEERDQDQHTTMTDPSMEHNSSNNTASNLRLLLAEQSQLEGAEAQLERILERMNRLEREEVETDGNGNTSTNSQRDPAASLRLEENLTGPQARMARLIDRSERNARLREEGARMGGDYERLRDAELRMRDPISEVRLREREIGVRIRDLESSFADTTHGLHAADHTPNPNPRGLMAAVPETVQRQTDLWREAHGTRLEGRFGRLNPEFLADYQRARERVGGARSEERRERDDQITALLREDAPELALEYQRVREENPIRVGARRSDERAINTLREIETGSGDHSAFDEMLRTHPDRQQALRMHPRQPRRRNAWRGHHMGSTSTSVRMPSGDISARVDAETIGSLSSPEIENDPVVRAMLQSVELDSSRRGRVERILNAMARRDQQQQQQQAPGGVNLPYDPSSDSTSSSEGDSDYETEPRRRFSTLHRTERLQRDRGNNYYYPPADPSRGTTNAPPRAATSRTSTLAKTIEYLSRLRDCTTAAEGLAAARDLGIIDPMQDDPASEHFMYDLHSLPPLPRSSWLTPGATFTGSQHAPNEPGSSATGLGRDRDYLRRMVANRNLNQNQTQSSSETRRLPGSARALAEAERLLSSSGTGTSSQITSILSHDGPGETAATNTTTGASSSELRSAESWLRWEHRALSTANTGLGGAAERGGAAPVHWPVSVTLHSVDWENLTLTGTMSAKHIPDKYCPGSSGTSMQSFFEGEIIDFRNVGLETGTGRWGGKTTGNEIDVGWREGFESSRGLVVGIETDAEYWGQIGPVGRLGAKTKVGVEGEREREMLRRRWCEGAAGGEWVLMRWKERCFLPPSDSNSWGLTISGFYYIALHRETGKIEGLYYDPGSQPYQRLDLVPEGTLTRSAKGSGGLAGEVGGRSGKGGGVRKWFPSVEFR